MQKGDKLWKDLEKSLKSKKKQATYYMDLKHKITSYMPLLLI